MNDQPLIAVQAGGPGADRAVRSFGDLGGRPALEFMLRRVRTITDLVDCSVVVVTTELPADDPIVAIASDLDIPTVRGPAHDRLRGFSMAHVRAENEHIVRVGDHAPLTDPFMILAALDLHRETGAHYTSNLLPRSYPTGLEVEVISSVALRCAELEATSAADRNDVTGFIQRHPERFRLANLQSGHDVADERWRLDDPADLARLNSLVNHVHGPLDASWNRLLATAGRTNKPRRDQVRLRPMASPPPASDPWERRWEAIVNGVSVGVVAVTTGSGGNRRTIEVAEPWTEAASDALYEMLLDDPATRT